MGRNNLLLVCIVAFTVSSSLFQVNHALKEGMYYYGNGKMWRVFTDGKIEKISRGQWSGTRCMASYNDRLFAVWKSGLYEVLEKGFKLFGAGYSRSSAMVQLGRYLYATIGKSKCGQLYRITVGEKTASMKRWGSVGIYSLGLAAVNGDDYLIGVDENWVLISTRGDGITLAPGSATAVTSSPDGYVYAIDFAGDVNIIDAGTGRVAVKLTNGGLFTGSRSLVWFQKSLYAIGKDQRFYKINIENGGASTVGTSQTWDVKGRMAAIN